MCTSKPVLSKPDFVRRFLANEFGNRGPTWSSIADLLQSGYPGLVHLRNRVAGGDTFYNLRLGQAVSKWQAIARPSNWYCAAMAPTAKTLLQGEVQRGPWGYNLFYTTVAKPMRDALREWSRQVYGIIASYLLREYLCPNSHEWLLHLLDTYPEHVVEFSTYSTNWGTIPGFNTVFWEIRCY